MKQLKEKKKQKMKLRILRTWLALLEGSEGKIGDYD